MTSEEARLWIKDHQADRLVDAEAALCALVEREVRKAFAEGRDAALANAAMKAYDMGYPDVRIAINALMPDDSPCIPMDDPRFVRPALREGQEGKVPKSEPVSSPHTKEGPR